VLNMDSTMGFNMIDTEDPDKAIDDLARLTQKATMRHMAVGGWDNVNAVWDWAHNFNCDMVLMNDNIACKGMLGVHAIMEEQARELGFRFIFIEHDLEDSRTVSRQNMRDCVNQYMSIVLNEEPLDPTLLSFDDSDAY
jgi:2-hydroxyglutaryl-CoA dehydratase, D-component.